MINSSSLRLAIESVLQSMPPIESDLNEADSKLGDGDTGGMLARVIGALAEVETQDDIGGYLVALSRASNQATGSSLGNLIATALSVIGRRSKGKSQLEPSEVSSLLAAARDAMIERGGAELGDKTVIDAIAALSDASQDKHDWASLKAAVIRSSQDVIVAYRGKPIKIGRARMFGDATKELNDPGMLAVAMVIEAAFKKPEATGILHELKQHREN